jgi:uncharacterized protein
VARGEEDFLTGKTMIQKLENCLKEYQKVAVAYSGGVDSTFLLATCARVLGEKQVLALTIESPLTPPWEIDFAKGFCQPRGIPQLLLDGSAILENEHFATNPAERCYFCKRKVLQMVKNAVPVDFTLLTGTNATDVSDFRPGMKAEEEMGVKTPLRELGIPKDKIRQFSRVQGIPGSERPPCACFATRIPTGESITLDKIERIRKAEVFLRERGFETVRVRWMAKDAATIEVAQEKIEDIFGLREEILQAMKEIGFRRATVDLEGYRQGKLNEKR